MCSFVFMLMSSRKDSVTRTIRIEKADDDILVREADRNGYSVNSFLGQIIRRYTQYGRFHTNGSTISLSRETIISLISDFSDDLIEDIGERAGRSQIEQSLLQRGLTLNLENLIWYVDQVIGEYSGWFRCDHYKDNGIDNLHLSHNNSRKWSVFLRAYITAILKEAVDKPVNSVVLSNAVHISVKR